MFAANLVRMWVLAWTVVLKVCLTGFLNTLLQLTHVKGTLIGDGLYTKLKKTQGQ